MAKCVNSYALEAHENVLAKEEARRDAFNEEVSDELCSLFEDLELKYKEIAAKHRYNYSASEVDSFHTHISKEW